MVDTNSLPLYEGDEKTYVEEPEPPPPKEPTLPPPPDGPPVFEGPDTAPSLGFAGDMLPDFGDFSAFMGKARSRRTPDFFDSEAVEKEIERRASEKAAEALQQVQDAAVAGENIFDVLMEACKWCSLGQMTEAMFDVGGAYRRNM